VVGLVLSRSRSSRVMARITWEVAEVEKRENEEVCLEGDEEWWPRRVLFARSCRP
jgi:hypothetical protein